METRTTEKLIMIGRIITSYAPQEFLLLYRTIDRSD